MKKVIWKYPLELSGSSLEMPKNARILTVQSQDDTPTIWALIDPDYTETETRIFRIVGTGFTFDIKDWEYIGTTVVNEDRFVWHVFEKRRS